MKSPQQYTNVFLFRSMLVAYLAVQTFKLYTIELNSTKETLEVLQLNLSGNNFTFAGAPTFCSPATCLKSLCKSIKANTSPGSTSLTAIVHANTPITNNYSCASPVPSKYTITMTVIVGITVLVFFADVLKAFITPYAQQPPQFYLYSSVWYDIAYVVALAFNIVLFGPTYDLTMLLPATTACFLSTYHFFVSIRANWVTV